MPYFLVTLHGDGIEIPRDDGSGPMIGFYRTCLVRADGPTEAARIASDQVSADWTSQRYAGANKGNVPRLKTEAVVPANFLQRFTFKNGGHVFYGRREAGVE
jgi:hypothetical protein